MIFLALIILFADNELNYYAIGRMEKLSNQNDRELDHILFRKHQGVEEIPFYRFDQAASRL